MDGETSMLTPVDKDLCFVISYSTIVLSGHR
jgi:hypothetical protein